MIARRIFVMVDAYLIVLAFVIAHALTPLLWPARSAIAEFILHVLPSQSQYFQPGPDEIAPLSQLVWMLLVVCPTVMMVLLAIDAYDRLHDTSRTRMLLAGPIAAAMGMTVAALVIFLLRTEEWSRVFLITFTALMAVALTSLRVFIRAYHHWQARNGQYRCNILLTGAAEVIPTVAEAIAGRRPQRDVEIIGYLDTREVAATDEPIARGGPAAGSAAETSAGVAVLDHQAAMVLGSPPRLGQVGEIEKILLQHPVHEVIATPWGDSNVPWVANVIHACDHAGISFRLMPEVLLACRLANLVPREEGTGHRQDVPSILLAARVWDADALHVKRLIDIVLSLAALIVLAPLFAVVAVLVRLSSPGPILYPCNLVGQNGKPFVAWKFRTMVPNANALKSSLLALNEMTGPVFKIRHDPRVTTVGRWLRKYSLDELPQLISVLKGDQSLVGPRAASAHEFERYEFWQMRKISVRPGITCFWQIRGRNQISNFDDWIKMDLEYIDNWSLWLDFKILVRTAVVVIRGTGY